MLPFYCCWCCYYTTGRAYAGQIFPVGVDVMLPFYCCWCCYYTTGRAYAGQIFPVGLRVALPFLLLLVLLLHYSEGTCCKNFRRLVYTLRCRFYCCWCCYYTTARVNAAQIFAVGVRVMLPFYCCWCCFYTTGRAYAGKIFPVGVDVMLPFYCCWCCYYTTAKAHAAKKNSPFGIRVAVPFFFTAVGAITLRRG